MEKFLKQLSVEELAKRVQSGEISCEQLVRHYMGQIEKYKHKNAVLEVFEDAIDNAKEIDQKIKQKEKVGKLCGVPVIIKDNIMYEGKKCSCGSKFLKDYVAQYSATAIKKILAEGAVIIGRSNMDEFGMGSSCENSAFGPCLNAHSDRHVAGGSSGGSAVAVALGLCAFALGTDTGGSVRQPSSFNGVVGVKPSYGRVSRYGLVAYASGFDQIGPITKSVADADYVLSIISGQDSSDQTSVPLEIKTIKEEGVKSLKGVKFGVIKQIKEIVSKTEYAKIFDKLISDVQKQGAEVKYYDIPEYELSLSAYYIIAFAESTSNLGRFDGVKYTTRAEGVKEIGEVYKKSRTEGFGEEVKRRIMLGNFVLSSGYFDAYYKNAKRVQKLIKRKIQKVFEEVDIVLMPTTYGESFVLGEKTKDPVSMYAEDMFTIFANLTGLPAVSIPCGRGEEGLPLGLQLIAKDYQEGKLLSVAQILEGGYAYGKA